MVLKEIDALKEHSRTQQKVEVVEPGDKISDLKTKQPSTSYPAQLTLKEVVL